MGNYKKDNAAIIQMIKQGGAPESKAIALLIRENKSKVVSMVRKYNASNVEAQDVFLEGITEVVFNIRNDRFRNDCAISTYLHKICRLIWFQKFRSKKTSHFHQDEFDQNTLSLQFNLEYSNQKEVLDSVLDQIGADCKKVLTSWAEGFKMKEIQQKMNYASPQVAMNKKNKCLNKLKELIRDNKALQQIMEELRDGR